MAKSEPKRWFLHKDGCLLCDEHKHPLAFVSLEEAQAYIDLYLQDPEFHRDGLDIIGADSLAEVTNYLKNGPPKP